MKRNRIAATAALTVALVAGGAVAGLVATSNDAPAASAVSTHRSAPPATAPGSNVVPSASASHPTPASPTVARPAAPSLTPSGGLVSPSPHVAPQPSTPATSSSQGPTPAPSVTPPSSGPIDTPASAPIVIDLKASETQVNPAVVVTFTALASAPLSSGEQVEIAQDFVRNNAAVGAARVLPTVCSLPGGAGPTCTATDAQSYSLGGTYQAYIIGPDGIVSRSPTVRVRWTGTAPTPPGGSFAISDAEVDGATTISSGAAVLVDQTLTVTAAVPVQDTVGTPFTAVFERVDANTITVLATTCYPYGPGQTSNCSAVDKEQAGGQSNYELVVEDQPGHVVATSWPFTVTRIDPPSWSPLPPVGWFGIWGLVL
jgi:hypothetical protein